MKHNKLLVVSLLSLVGIAGTLSSCNRSSSSEDTSSEVVSSEKSSSNEQTPTSSSNEQEYTISIPTSDDYTITDLSATKAKEGDTVTFKIALTNSKKEIVSVKANENECVLNDGLYSFAMGNANIQISVTLKDKVFSYVFEAEDAYFSGKEKIESTNRASGNKSISLSDMGDGDTISFKALALEEGQADLKIYLNTVDGFTFEDVYTLKVNGKAITVGEVKGSGWDGSGDGANFDFRNPVLIKGVDFIKGVNVIELTVVNHASKAGNFDRLEICTSIEILDDAQVFEAEDASLAKDNAFDETNDASGGKCFTGLNETDDTLIFYINSDKATTADLGFDINLNDPITVSDYMEVRVNGALIDFGKTKGYWKGNIYHEFGHLVRANINLKEGENKISFTVVDGSKCENGKLNFDRIVFQNTEASLSWVENPIFKADIVATSSDGYTISDLSATEAKAGDKVTFKVNLTDESKEIESVKVYGEDVTLTDGVYSFVMTSKLARIKVALKEKPVEHSITITSSDDYEITDLSATSALEGSNVTFKVNVKNEKKEIDKVLVNEETTTPSSEGVYSFIMPNENVTISVNLVDKMATKTYVFEAENAYYNGKARFDKTSRASGNRSLTTKDMAVGDTVTFKANAKDAGKGNLKFYLNTVDAFNFEDAYTLKVNDVSFTIGQVKGSGWDGSGDGANFDFRNPVVLNDVDLQKGLNIIELTVVGKGNKITNLDRIEIESTVKFYSDAQVFEAEDATLSDGVSTEETTDASGNACVSSFNQTDQSVTFHVNSDIATTADLGFDINMNDPMVVSDYMKITVNNDEITYPDQTLSYWAGNVYHEFGHVQRSQINLIEGENVIVFTVKDGSKCGNGKLNFDRILFSNTIATLSKVAE